MDNAVNLPSDSNQALGIAQYAIDFMGDKWKGPSESVLRRVAMFHSDAVLCGLSALALRTNAPVVLRAEAREYPACAGEEGARVFGSSELLKPEKAILANTSAVREWDSNGTVFGYNKKLGHTAGEFGHNDFYGVVIAACQMKNLDGATALRAMVLIDEIRGRLAEVFSLKTYKIDHVVHGAIAAAAVFGALLGASAPEIESAIGMTVAHFIPFRAIRAGKQLSDSKGASAAISTEVAIMSMKRSMAGFVGPRDIFRNPESIFRLNEPTAGDRSPFRLVLSHSGDDFAVMGMHFKLGLYEHQSAGAIQGLLDVLLKFPSLASDPSAIEKVTIAIYQPAFGIIGDPAKRNPTTRQSADHSMVFIIASILKKALSLGESGLRALDSNRSAWSSLMLLPVDYSKSALNDPATRKIMENIVFRHGGKEYDDRYPDGIPTSVSVTQRGGEVRTCGDVQYPSGHARASFEETRAILQHKWLALGVLAVGDEKRAGALIDRLNSLGKMNVEEIQTIYEVDIAEREPID
eukprot:152616_1